MTYFARWPPWAARLVLLTMGVLVLSTLYLPHMSAPAPPWAAVQRYSDGDLYRDIAQRVGAGENYYTVAADEHRAHNYPTTPPQVFREPTETWLLIALHAAPFRWIAVLALAIGTTLVLRGAMDQVPISPRQRLGAVLLMSTGIANAGMRSAPYMHEVWASLLIVLSLCFYRPQRWAVSMGLALAACLFRELALPFLFVMAAFAFLEKRPREGLAWVAAIAAFCAVFAWHLVNASGLHRPGDLASDSWLAWGGWSFMLKTARRNAILVLLPAWVVAAVVCLAVIGLAGYRHPWVNRIALTVTGYLAAFAVVGRPENDYWGILYAPLLPLGLVLAPQAMRDLMSRALGRDVAGTLQATGDTP
jgi:hypothetical protein